MIRQRTLADFLFCDFLYKSRDSRDVISKDQQMNVMGSLVCNNGFQIHHMSHDRIFTSDSHTAVDLSSFARDLKRNSYVVSFRQ
jgi:hypothetical protein